MSLLFRLESITWLKCFKHHSVCNYYFFLINGIAVGAIIINMGFIKKERLSYISGFFSHNIIK